MRETTLKDILEQIALEEVNEYKSMKVPKVRFSLRHKIRMRRIFKMYNKKVHGNNMRRLGVRGIIILTVIIFLAALGVTGAAVTISRLTGEQKLALNSRYDVSVMNVNNVTMRVVNGQTHYYSEPSAEFRRFIGDLSALGVYHAEDIHSLSAVPFIGDNAVFATAPEDFSANEVKVIDAVENRIGKLSAATGGGQLSKTPEELLAKNLELYQIISELTE